MSTTKQLRLGTRGSLLARAQSQQVADALMQQHPGLQVNLVEIHTTGDREQSKPLHDIGGKGLFTREVELALLASDVDLAVHSMKDLPITQPLVDTEALVVAAIPARQAVEDVIYSPAGHSYQTLPAGSRVATGSLRRQAQWRLLRPDVSIHTIRGNIDTRLRKVREGDFDAVVLAAAGLHRAGLFDPQTMKLLPADQFVPAAGQGALAIQCRRDDASTREILAGRHDLDTSICVQMERSIVQALQGDCHSPIAAWATITRHKPVAGMVKSEVSSDLANRCSNPRGKPTVDNDILSYPDGTGMISLLASVAGRGGVMPIIRARASGPALDWKPVLEEVINQLLAQGAMILLHG